MALTHDMNQQLIRLIRETGGRNADRFLLLCTWGAISGKMPIELLVWRGFEDTADDRSAWRDGEALFEGEPVQGVVEKQFTLPGNYRIVLSSYQSVHERRGEQTLEFAIAAVDAPFTASILDAETGRVLDALPEGAFRLAVSVSWNAVPAGEGRNLHA